jgi:hypothetical protein
MGPLDRGAIAQSSFGRSKTEPPAKFCCRPLRHRVCLKSARFFSYEIPNPAVGPRLNSDKSRASVISKMILQEHGASMVSWQPTLCLEARAMDREVCPLQFVDSFNHLEAECPDI